MKEHTQHKKRFPILVWLPFVTYYVMQYKVYILNIKNEKVVTFYIALFLYIVQHKYSKTQKYRKYYLVNGINNLV